MAASGPRLHVRRVVEPPAPPILLLHGLGVAGSVWQPFARRLVPHYSAVAPDLRGHGQSDTPPDGYRPDDYARDLVSLFGPLIAPPAPVLGQSLGALVAVALGALRPDLVSALILVDPPLDASLASPGVAQVYRLRHAPPGELEAYLLDSPLGGGTLLAQALAALYRQAADAAFETLLASAPGHPETWAQAQRLQPPTLVLQADPARGGVLGDAAAHAFATALPHGRLLHVPSARHAMHASHPAEVAAAVLQFLGRSSTAAR